MAITTEAREIVLTTINARFAHTALGLRYLKANLGDYESRSEIIEFVLGQSPTEMAEQILARQPKILAMSVYIWNINESTSLVQVLKQIAPTLLIVLGGPEVSHEPNEQTIVRKADYLITGWGDVSFRELVHGLLHGPKPLMKIITGKQPPLKELVRPYALYSDADIKHRLVYVEASRGCPFKCEFCLSSLDKTAWAFDTALFLADLESLYTRGVRTFKFIDRTFNLNIKVSLQILAFFLDKLAQYPDDPVFAHFEVVPDHLPDALKESIAQFPPGALQFEIGIQTFNPEVQALISRKQNNAQAAENIRWIHEHSHAHMHVDLIAGLPSETMESFAQGFNHLHKLGPHEIQLGILKRLRGTPIIRHTEAYEMRYHPEAPYQILANNAIGFTDMQRISRFSRYWDMVANSGRFTQSSRLLLGENAFERFMDFSDWLYAKSGKTHAIALEKLADYVYDWLTLEAKISTDSASEAVLADYSATGAKGRLKFMHSGLSVASSSGVKSAIPQRQRNHLNAQTHA